MRSTCNTHVTSEHDLTPDDTATLTIGYDAGYQAGFTAGLEAADQHADACWRAAVAATAWVPRDLTGINDRHPDRTIFQRPPRALTRGERITQYERNAARITTELYPDEYATWLADQAGAA